MSSITTKFGDTGNTRLYSNETVSKKSKRIWSCGDIDELVSMLGVAYSKTHPQDISLKLDIEYLQKTLFIVASEIATLEPKLSKLSSRIDSKVMDILDSKRDFLEQSLELPKGFILPGENEISAYLDVCRAMSRRCERTITELYNEGFISNKYLLMWMNRLSDYLYLLARYSEKGRYRMVK